VRQFKVLRRTSRFFFAVADALPGLVVSICSLLFPGCTFNICSLAMPVGSSLFSVLVDSFDASNETNLTGTEHTQALHELLASDGGIMVVHDRFASPSAHYSPALQKFSKDCSSNNQHLWMVLHPLKGASILRPLSWISLI
jgi:hypothetical protein